MFGTLRKQDILNRRTANSFVMHKLKYVNTFFSSSSEEENTILAHRKAWIWKPYNWFYLNE